MDGILFKVRDGGKVINKTIYRCIGLTKTAIKEVGLWLAKAESASFWMSLLTDLKALGVEDILINCTDNLNGLAETISSVFPEAATQICVEH